MVTLAGIGGVTGTAFRALRALKAERRATPATGGASVGVSRECGGPQQLRDFVEVDVAGQLELHAPGWPLRRHDRRPHGRSRPASPLSQCRGEVADRRGSLEERDDRRGDPASLYDEVERGTPPH